MRYRGQRAHARGFTLIELMVVVVIIGILAAIAVPGVVERLRERRATQAAQEIGLTYRDARMRALGHGSAVLVHFDSGTLNGFEVREAVLGANAQASGCAAQPTGGCVSNNWTVASQYRVVDTFHIGRTELQEAGVVVNVTSPTAGAGVGYLDVCFTPRGRSFSRDTSGAPMTPLTGIVSINVNRGTQSIQRTVTVPPNGMGRVAL